MELFVQVRLKVLEVWRIVRLVQSSQVQAVVLLYKTCPWTSRRVNNGHVPCKAQVYWAEETQIRKKARLTALDSIETGKATLTISALWSLQWQTVCCPLWRLILLSPVQFCNLLFYILPNYSELGPRCFRFISPQKAGEWLHSNKPQSSETIPPAFATVLSAVLCAPASEPCACIAKCLTD